MKEKMRIGELAERAGVTPRTIRYYESLGLLGPNERQGAGFRYYTETELARLKQIDHWKRLDLSLEEIAGIIDLFFDGNEKTQGRQKLLEILEPRLRETDQKIASLQQFRSELIHKIADLKQKIGEAQAK